MKIVLHLTLGNLRQLRTSIYDEKFCIIVSTFPYKCFLLVNCNKTKRAIFASYNDYRTNYEWKKEWLSFSSKLQTNFELSNNRYIVNDNHLRVKILLTYEIKHYFQVDKILYLMNKTVLQSLLYIKHTL